MKLTLQIHRSDLCKSKSYPQWYPQIVTRSSTLKLYPLSMKLCFVTIAASFIFLPVFLVNAQITSCGNIVTPANYDYEGSTEYADPIADCTNPLGRTGDLDNFRLNSQTITNNSAISVSATGTADYKVGTENYFVSSGAQYYKHSGADFVRVRTNFETPTRLDVEKAIRVYFNGNEAQTQKYTDIYFDNNRDSLFYDDFYNTYYFDTVANDFVWRVFAFVDAHVRETVISLRPALLLGTYTVAYVDTDEGGGVNPTFEPSLLQKLFATVIPAAQAYYYVNTVTFTLTGPAPLPTGASSVLFLPGIMGSRLYEDTNFCDNESGETELWLTRSTCKQLRLSTSFTGASIHNLYTKSNEVSVVDEGYGFNLYKTFITSLKNWKSSGVITDYALVPYDWRLRLDDLLKAKLDDSTGKITYSAGGAVKDGHLYKTLIKLSPATSTQKITIVAHSNGGLLTKVLLEYLKNSNDPIFAKIDTVILVASPQLGTPNTLLGMLHGDVIGPLGSVVSQQTTRTLMNTMPFAYHLLPSSDYFAGTGVTVKTPVISFENGTITTPLANTFSSSITTAPTMQNFLNTASGRIKPAVDDLAVPEVMDSFLFNYSNTIHQLLNNWTPPTTMKVYQIAGIGLPTMSGLTYFTDQECTTRSFPNVFKCATYKPKLGMRPNETIDGDGTVVTPSALGMSTSQDSVKRLWLNLKNYNNDSVFNRYHSDIFEVQDIINFVKNTIEATTSAPYLYLTDTAPSLPNENRLVFDLHSPLDLSIVTADGGVVSSSSVTVEGAQYKRFGEMQHISMLNTSSKKTVKLNGTATGSFTLEIGEQLGTFITKRHTYSAIPSSTSTKVTIDLNSAKPIEQSVVSVDYDGNGTPEIAYNTNGEILPVITYTTLTTAINRLSINVIYKKLLLENAKIAEQYQLKSLTQTKFKKLEILALNVLKQQVTLYERLKVLTPLQKQELVGIIDKLIIK